MIAVVMVYAGLVAVLAGLVGLLKPLRVLGMRSRQAGAVLLGSGLMVAIVGAALPAGLQRSEAPGSHIDRVLPAYQFQERHSTRVHAPPDQVFQAVKATTVEEISLLRALMAIRSLGAARLPEETPFLDVLSDWGFVPLTEEPGRELVIGGLFDPFGDPSVEFTDAQAFREFDEPGHAKVALNFVVQDAGAGWSVVTTETRILSTSPDARRAFGAYWRVIYPGSSTIRTTWLQAIRTRAESH